MKTIFRYKNIKLQDVKVKFKALENVKVYISSYYMEAKESNTTFPNEVQRLYEVQDDMTIEMYNTTQFFVIPQDAGASNKFEMTFWVFEAQQYLYGNDYNLISKLISGVGGLILIVAVVIYLDGFSTLKQLVKDYMDRQRAAREEAAIRKKQQEIIDNSGAKGNAKGEKGKGDLDTQKSLDDISDDDVNFMGARAGGTGVHEGGQFESMRRRNI